MLRLCSNGVNFKTHFTLHLQRLLLYSTSAVTDKSPSSTVDFMVKTLGFTEEEAVTSLSKVSPSSKLTKSSENPKLVVGFLKEQGFNNTQMKKLISSLPQLLNYRVDRTLIPKFKALEELGVFGSDLTDIIASNSSILRRGFTNIKPMINYLKTFVTNEQKFFKILKRSYWLMSVDFSAKFQPNMELFRKYGISNERIIGILFNSSGILGHDPERLEDIFRKVEVEFGLKPYSASFTEAVMLLGSLSEETLERKFETFKSFGWTDFDIKSLMRKNPRCLMLSERLIRERLEYFMNELGYQPGYIAYRAYVLSYSMKDRVVPRYTILQVLKERKLITEVGMVTAVCSNESAFLERFVLPYKEELPELCTAYIGRVKGI